MSTIPIEIISSLIPSLSETFHKGSMGRIAVIGGSTLYTGGPYFAGITALKIGADLVHIFCTKNAGTAIKSYSPDLIVHPILMSEEEIKNEIAKSKLRNEEETAEGIEKKIVENITSWLDKLGGLIIGPGLGRDPKVINQVEKIILSAKEKKVPMVIDADGLFIITQNKELIKGNENVIITPNKMEFWRLQNSLFPEEKQEPNPKENPKKVFDLQKEMENVKKMSEKLGNVTVLKKGFNDIISNGKNTRICNFLGSSRRVSGQGDILSGAIGKLNSIVAGYAGCLITRKCNSLAFSKKKRSMTTSDMISEVGIAFESFFD
ncbi:atp-dependent (s)-nad(p)h-hydrate dehydratase family member [Anaeramoeba ignava]|uniref:ATP-dependent (S)-NAD(P)H-hydrate dehydratase n=1 Tax=Anaeramoeba ignava TaxID=1746090 RepID=A0A9Q0LRZ7_ANAIG|nr:atp-dependent (s)-nad(p)h-hydrate dehydratase family member [Anaeramoeba ignava]